MSNAVSEYLANIQAELSSGHAQEHSYRPALKSLFEKTTKLKVINEPKGSAHGRPDLIFVKGEIPIAWVEAKDLHINLDKVEKSEQMVRYFGYANLILTNGLEFRFFKNGKRYGESAILAIKDGEKINGKAEAHAPFERLVAGFIEGQADTIRSAQHLAQIMGGKAARLRDNITDMLRADYTGTKGVEIEKIRDILRGKLIHDLTNEQFADLYAQTLVYGLFVARYHDKTPETFTRTEARERIPASNHLLQQFFDHIAGVNFEKKLSFIVDELCDVFLHASVHDLVHGIYLKEGDTHDPIIHFYEDFLREYDPKLRASRGVFYTPLPIVRYIVRSVDALLKSDFGLLDGLADRAKMEWTHKVQGKKTKETIDRVQILDPAVGTGTFLNEVIRHVHGTFKGQEGSWPKFVEEHLLGRLNGFELMMASYTIAHLKLSMTLAETGVKETRKRLRVFLTNSLEEAPEKDDSLFQFIGLQGALTEESQMAAEVKRDLPIMVVIGNPPYSSSSQNASVQIGKDGKKRKTWIGELLEDYKRNLSEQNINSLSDDYVKFIRFAHHLVQKNGCGVVAMITNNSFLDGVTHRRMRESLLETFDDVFVLNLHGDKISKETAPNGGVDENVFDIQQGVSIVLFVKNSKTREQKLGQLHHFDLFGKRESKYLWLENNDLTKTEWHDLDSLQPAYYFVPKNFELHTEYDRGQQVSLLFGNFAAGIKFRKDNLLVKPHMTKESVRIMASDVCNMPPNALYEKYDFSDTSDWKLEEMRKLFDPCEDSDIQEVMYRVFDYRYCFYPPSRANQIIPRGDSRINLMRHMLKGANLGLITNRQIVGENWSHVASTTQINCHGTFYLGNRGQDYLMPLYLYPNSPTISGEGRTANLNMELLKPILKNLKVEWLPDGMGDGQKTCGPEDIFDYIYAVLHSPEYRSRYKEFLKIDFPRVPFTSSASLFWKLVSLGREVRGLHLLESSELKKLRTSYPVGGSDTVEKIRFEGGGVGKVWINATQYFGNVPNISWEFFIGGYQPAQKWLKDRKGRTLTGDDILHYQKIIIVLQETARLMQKIDEEIKASGGWPMK